MKVVRFTAPSHWAVAFLNGDESPFEYYEDESDYQNYRDCVKDLIKRYGNAIITDVTELGFSLKGDYGSLADEYSEYTLLYGDGEEDDDEEEDHE